MFLELVAVFAFILPTSLWIYSWSISEVPKYFTKPGTKLHGKIQTNLRILEQNYHPSWWCPFGTTQTIVRQIFRDCPTLPFIRQVVM
uniref:Uncharacterized protein n=1 Tax=Caenorhabditis japonica TaxID=281687 RepID=A0A8R1ENM9_CAEJA